MWAEWLRRRKTLPMFGRVIVWPKASNTPQSARVREVVGGLEHEDPE